MQLSKLCMRENCICDELQFYMKETFLLNSYETTKGIFCMEPKDKNRIDT